MATTLRVAKKRQVLGGESFLPSWSRRISGGFVILFGSIAARMLRIVVDSNRRVLRRGVVTRPILSQ